MKQAFPYKKRQPENNCVLQDMTLSCIISVTIDGVCKLQNILESCSNHNSLFWLSFRTVSGPQHNQLFNHIESRTSSGIALVLINLTL